MEKTASSGFGDLYMKSDERYVYFMIKTDVSRYDFDNDTLLIPIDTISGQGNNSMKDNGTSFDREADFVISINGKDNSRIAVDSYYDAHYFLYGELYKMIDPVSDIATKNSGRFSKMMLCTGYEMNVPGIAETIGFDSYETGKLRYGNGDPESPDYSSLSDFIYNDKEGVMEIRIPWQLLNVMDPSTHRIMGDFYTEQSITPVNLGEIYAGIGLAGETVSLNGSYTYDDWKMPEFHERLKPSYYVLREALKELK